MPKYVFGYSTCPDICLQPSCLEFVLDTEQPLSVLYHEESQIGINKQETQQRGTLSVYWKLARVSRTAASILRQVRTQIFHNNRDRVVKPARVQSCRYTEIYTQPLLQGLTLLPVLTLLAGTREWRFRVSQVFHHRQLTLILMSRAMGLEGSNRWEFTLTCW